ncbi:MAG: signal recognition particle-docking protein FtsY [Rhodobiaceae bacterium]|nr:signal recognition particle-docking protein FtsY [Rhodobiaceae bacterium]
MAEKKPGFFGRLFGARPEADKPVVETPAPEEAPAAGEPTGEVPPEPVQDTLAQEPPAPAEPASEPVPAETVAEALQPETPTVAEPVVDAPEEPEVVPQGEAPAEAPAEDIAPEVQPAEEPVPVETVEVAEPVLEAPPPEEPVGEIVPEAVQEAIAQEPQVPEPAAPPPPEPEPAPPAEPVAEATAPEAAEPEPAYTPPAAPEPTPEPQKKGWFSRLREGLSRSSSQLGQSITGIFTKRKLDQAMLDDLEDALLQADLGLETAMAITDALAKDRFDKDISPEEVRAVLSSEVEKVLAPVATPLEIGGAHRPHVILMVGVNGSGKTTTIGKLAQKFGAEGRSVMLAAGDTFRAAAIEQLKIWGERTGVPVISGKQGADASGLAFDALKAAKEAGTDVLMIDTAGRLQNRTELMAELEKIVRVIRKQDETAPHSVLLVLDATTGQNALQQVEIFGKTAGVTGLVMTKLDGTAKGGILVAIAAKHKLPVHFIGIGEAADDLQPFSAKDFARAIAGSGD